MTDEQLAAGDRAVRDLWGTPVGRRWLLKMAGAAGAGAVLSGIVGSPAAAHPPAPATRWRKTGRTERIQFHFALGGAADATGLEVRANGERVALIPHTPLSRVRLLGQGSLWLKVRRSRLTHYATVRVPRDRGMIMSVHGTRKGKPVIVAHRWHAPTADLRTVARAAYRLERSYRSVVGTEERLNNLGLKPTHIRSVDEVTDLDTVFDPHQTAMTLCGYHPNVATITEVATTKTILTATPEVSTLGAKISAMHAATQDFAILTPAVNPNGTPTQIKVGDTTTTFSTASLNPDSTFQGTVHDAVVAGIHGVRDTGGLGKVVDQPLDALQDTSDTATWRATEGVVNTATPYTPPTGVGAGVTVTVANTGLLHGTYTALNGSLNGRQVPLRLYNNYVRFVWVYVQYLKADGVTNLSANSSPTAPDTAYSQSLGMLPQVFTVLGVPIWDTNTLDVTLNFPLEATSARILYCGLGNDAIDGGWRQYFPATAYPHHIAPEAEVKIAGIITGLLCIGLSAFALLTDLDIATTWGTIRKEFEGNAIEWLQDIEGVPNVASLTAGEAFAATTLAGAATIEDVEANGNAQNIWSILASLGALIPKIIFNPAASELWLKVAFDILSIEAADKLTDAIPIIGEVVAILSAVGDAATLAEAIGETASSPWVIGNQVSLSYLATVTVSKDVDDPEWPATGRSWRLEATIDGATAVQPMTASFNPDGNSSAPVVVQLNPPFGGTTITWSFVVLNATGHQVGTGTAKLPNNDPANVPTAVPITITEIPATVDDTTVFTRTVTTAYDPTVSGYTWAPRPADTATTYSGGIQEITGVAIATRLGVAGVVWKANDLYYLRGVPIVQNGPTITIGGATRQGFARRPFLLFDAFVGDADVGNHVLLEPDDTTDAYHIRALTINPTNGALTWDSAVSLGDFDLPIDAAALHSSGRVIAVHTDSGRLSHLMPAATPRPPRATYSAGPGTEIGLLSSPVAVAVTNPGTVLVLESDVSPTIPYQLAAFDLNGNPSRYFGTGTPAAFTLPLPTGRTYLDLSVDGANDIYLLSNAGDDSQPDQYRIDVYNPNGTPLDTQSTGTNIPHFAIDYWRSIYAANYTPLLNTTTKAPHIGSLNVPEPSLSRWDPADPS